MNNEITVIGITGGIGAGKTVVAKYLLQKGFTLINADDIAKEIIAHDVIIKQKLINIFGKESFVNDQYNAQYISNLVFNLPDAEQNLAKLNQIIHPAVIQNIIDKIENLQTQNINLVFVEIALLFELALENGFDYIITVQATENIRHKRIAERNNLTPEQIENRMKAQISQEEKVKNSDFVIDNDKTIDDLYKSIDFLIPIIEQL